jgi:hypothetical protein
MNKEKIFIIILVLFLTFLLLFNFIYFLKTQKYYKSRMKNNDKEFKKRWHCLHKENISEGKPPNHEGRPEIVKKEGR